MSDGFLPFVDQHSVVIDGDLDRAWDAVADVFGRSFAGAGREQVATMLGCEDTSVGGPAFPALGATVPGFHVEAVDPPRTLALAGRHRFSDYALIFHLEPDPGEGVRVTAETRAAFPGVAGRAYRAAVIGTRGHVVAVRSMLDSIERRAGSHGGGVARTWGSTPAERRMAFPCDEVMDDPGATYFRAVDVDAPAATVFRWLCQLKVAPYSYDSLDNFGRRSPRTLTPGVDDLRVGDSFMTIFDLVAFDPDRHITLSVARLRGVFRDCAVTYLVEPREHGASRLVVKLVLGEWARGPVPWLELVMMRRQLLNLRELAEATARA